MAHKLQYILISKCQRCNKAVTREIEGTGYLIQGVDGLVYNNDLKLRVCVDCDKKTKEYIEVQRHGLELFKNDPTV